MERIVRVLLKFMSGIKVLKMAVKVLRVMNGLGGPQSAKLKKISNLSIHLYCKNVE